MLTGTRDEPFVRFMERELRRGMTFVDVGAGIGFFTLLAAIRVDPSRVYAYEYNAG